jgi:outer membrane lipoprotein
MMKRKVIVSLAAALLAVSQVLGCSPPFSRELLDQVDRTVTYAELQKTPDRFTGRVLMLGGTIVDTKNLQEGARIEVLQRPLDGKGRPEPTDVTGGRFLVQTDQFLDGAVYHRDRAVTVVGEVIGSEELRLGDILYRYPVLRAKDLHLWAPSRGPGFSIGIGVYHGF